MSACWYLSRIKQFCLVSFLLLAGGTPIVFPAKADHLQDIKSSGVLRWGADAEGGAPYVYPDPQNPEHLVGFEWELAEALAAKLGVKARMVQNQWDQLIPALERGNFDIILNGLEITPQNQQRIGLSLPYFAYAQQIVTRRDTDGLTNLEACTGRRVGVLSYSAAQRLVEKMGGANMVIYPGNVESFRDLKAKRIDVVVLDLPIALFYAKPDPDLKFSGGAFAPGYYGIGLRTEDATLSAAINKAITELGGEGTLERIYRKYGLWD
jgi:polar amino acid transport system substrate-binding protein